MKTKTFKSALSVAILFAAIIVWSSCSKSDNGSSRDAYVGSYRTNWSYAYNGVSYSGTYTLTVTKSSTNSNDIILGNIDGWGESARATISGNSMTIPQQTILDVGISGSGILNGNVLNFSTAETETGGTQINVTQVATKQ